MTLLSWAASDCALITLLGLCFLEKSKPSRNANVKLQQSWMSWLNSSCAGCETYGGGQHKINEMNCAVVRDPQARLPNMKRKERPLCLYLAGPSWKGHEVHSDTQTCTSVLLHLSKHKHTQVRVELRAHTKRNKLRPKIATQMTNTRQHKQIHSNEYRHTHMNALTWAHTHTHTIVDSI